MTKKKTTNIIKCCILFVLVFLIFGYIYTDLKTIHESTEQILTQYKTMYIDLTEEHMELQNVLNETSANLDKAKSSIDEYNSLFSDYQKSENDIIKKSSYGLFKSYMDYRVLQNPSSIEYQLQQKAYTDEYGLRKIDDYYCIAIGTGWNCKVGDKMIVVLSDGSSFRAIMGDTKDDNHTDAETHKVTVKPHADGSVIEFIVDSNKVKEFIGESGNISKINKFKGSIIGIYKL